jgi:hypothetical protein
MYCVLAYENRAMKLVEIVLRRSRGMGESKVGIQ